VLAVSHFHSQHLRVAIRVGLIAQVALIGLSAFGAGQVSSAAAAFAQVSTTPVSSPATARTQTATATLPAATATPPTIGPTGPPIFSLREAVLFPMLVRFQVVLRLPVANLKAAQLRIFQGKTFDQTVDIPQNSFKVVNDQASLIDYPWPLPIQNALTPFEPVDYVWTIAPTTGATITGGQRFVYSDALRQWQQSEGDPLVMYTYDQNLAVDVVRSSVLRAYTLIAQTTNVHHTFSLVLYDVGDDFCQRDPARPNQPVVIDPRDQVEFPCDPTQAAKLYAAGGFLLVQRTSQLLEGLQDQLIEIIAADAYDTVWKAAAEQPPAWFRAGLIQMYGLVGHSYSLLLAREAARTDQLLTLDVLAAPPVQQSNDNGASVREWNAQSFMLTLYIAARFGASAPFAIAQRIAQKGKFADALSAIGKGIALTDLYAGWQDWLFSPDADAAMFWNPYLTNNTPTPTPSPTDFPTLTPTSNEPAATDTEVSLPTLTYTPAPTQTPAPPTHTPLPPGSLNTPTASPKS
jgi:hypothetical protein